MDTVPEFEKGKYIDLHTHSVFSDGTYTPRQIVSEAAEIGLCAVALTDHDTLDGIESALDAGREFSVKVIPGIEFSVENDFPMHILGLNISPDCEELKQKVNQFSDERKLRMAKILKKLKTLGINITQEDMSDMTGTSSVGRCHVAAAMMNKGYTSSVSEGFEKYLGFGKPAYVARKRITPQDVIALIKRSGGKSFVAHLNQTGKSLTELEKILSNLKKAGLDGVEGYYTQYTEETGKQYRLLAARLGLILSGGSDFHGKNKPGIFIGKGYGNLRVPRSLLEDIEKPAEKAVSE